MIEKEIERKYILSEDKYKSIIDLLSSEYKFDKVTQINYYYDTIDFQLFKNDETLRVRQKNDKLKLEYKYGKKIKDSIRTCLEFSKDIGALPKKIHNSKSEDEYFNIGILVTERIDYKILDYIISLDKNYYLGYIDYEIEIESQNDFSLPDILCSINIVFSKNPKGKYTRFIKRLISSEKEYEL